VDPPGDNDLVSRCGPTSCDLIPGQDIGAIILADPFHQGPPLGELPGRGVGGSIDMGVASLMRTAYRPCKPGPSQLDSIA
jgi:hypothetical protein